MIDKIKPILIKILKSYPIIFLIVVFSADGLMHMTKGYKQTPTTVDDAIYYVVYHISYATHHVLQSSGITKGK